MKKIIILLLSIVFLINILYTPTAKAYTAEYDLNSLSPGTFIDVYAGQSIRVYTSGTGAYSIFIHIIGDSEVTLDNVSLDFAGLPAVQIDAGVSARIILSGSSVLKGGMQNPAICVPQTSSVTISGDGTLNAIGGDYAAGIGGQFHNNTGNILIEDKAVVNAQGGLLGAGIGSGSGSNNNSFIVSIKDEAKVTAQGGENGAGIGSGADCISGTATINISGDSTVSAVGGENASGIGSGITQSSFVRISMSGGKVYAAGNNGYADISGILECSISGDTALFLANNLTNAGLSTPDGHSNQTSLPFNGNTVYGVTVDPLWTGALGGYFRLRTLTYGLNGGTGSAPAPVTQHYGTTAVLDSGAGLTRSGYTFGGWNTSSDGNGTNYSAGGSYTFSSDATLYAKWVLIPTPTPTPKATAAPTSTPRKNYATAAPTATPTPEPTAVLQAEPSSAYTPETTLEPTAEPTPLPSAAITAQVSSNGGTSTATIDVSSLPEGTKAVKLPNGEILSIENAVDGKLTFEVEESWISGGIVEIIAIDDEEIPLGYYSIDIPVEETLQKTFPVWLMIVGGIFLLFWVVFAFARIFRAKTNPRYTRR